MPGRAPRGSAAGYARIGSTSEPGKSADNRRPGLRRVVSFDPDSYIREHGPEDLAALAGVPFDPPPVLRVHPWRLAWEERCDGAALARLRGRCASGEAADDLAALDAQLAREAAGRAAEQLQRIAAERVRLGLDGPAEGRGKADPASRASRYLASISADSSGQAFAAAVALVRGFALDEGAALGLLEREYAPRFHRALPRRELVGMVQRAARASRTGYGYLLEGRR